MRRAPRRERRSDQLAGDLRLGGERHRLRHAHLPSSRCVSSPGVREIETPVDQRLTERARIAKEDTDLAVLDPPGGCWDTGLKPMRRVPRV